MNISRDCPPKVGSGDRWSPWRPCPGQLEKPTTVSMLVRWSGHWFDTGQTIEARLCEGVSMAPATYPISNLPHGTCVQRKAKQQ